MQNNLLNVIENLRQRLQVQNDSELANWNQIARTGWVNTPTSATQPMLNNAMNLMMGATSAPSTISSPLLAAQKLLKTKASKVKLDPNMLTGQDIDLVNRILGRNSNLTQQSVQDVGNLQKVYDVNVPVRTGNLPRNILEMAQELSSYIPRR